MPVQWGRDALDDLAARGFTRRHVLRVARAGGRRRAALPLGSERALAQLSDAGRIPDDAVKINANEFPEGPSERALAALAEAARQGNRYQYPETEALVEAAAELEGLRARALRGVPGLEPGAAPRRDRVHVADARPRRRRAGLRGGRRRRDVHRRAGGARAAARGRGPRPAGDAGGVEEAAGRVVLRLQSEQPDRHGDPARRRSRRWWPRRRATPWSCSTRRTSTCATSRAASIWCVRARTWSCCARSRRSSGWPACAPASRSRARTSWRA